VHVQSRTETTLPVCDYGVLVPPAVGGSFLFRRGGPFLIPIARACTVILSPNDHPDCFAPVDLPAATPPLVDLMALPRRITLKAYCLSPIEEATTLNKPGTTILRRDHCGRGAVCQLRDAIRRGHMAHIDRGNRGGGVSVEAPLTSNDGRTVKLWVSRPDWRRGA
jgi:hypothetical protein